MENILVAKTGYKVIGYYLEARENTLTVRCPPEYSTDDVYNFNVYSDLRVEDIFLYR